MDPVKKEKLILGVVYLFFHTWGTSHVIDSHLWLEVHD